MEGARNGLVGIWGRPFINLEPYLDLELLASLDDEICYALAQVVTGARRAPAPARTSPARPASTSRAPWPSCAPFFRYSLRVDGVFQPGFLERLRQDHAP